MKTETKPLPFVVSLNSTKVLEYFRDRVINQSQLDDLNKLESKLDAGFNIDGKFIDSPDVRDKAIFIANNLAAALIADNDSIAAVSCSYLATRYPDLQQLKISSNNGYTSIELIYDKEYTEQSPIKYISKKDLI